MNRLTKSVLRNHVFGYLHISKHNYRLQLDHQSASTTSIIYRHSRTRTNQSDLIGRFLKVLENKFEISNQVFGDFWHYLENVNSLKLFCLFLGYFLFQQSGHTDTSAFLAALIK